MQHRSQLAAGRLSGQVIGNEHARPAHSRVVLRPDERSSCMSNGPVQKDPQEWATGDEPMTAPQESYLRTLAREAGKRCRTA